MKLITKRLTVMTLTPEQMMMYMRNVRDLEKELTLSYHAEPLEGEFRDIVRKQARLCEDNENDYLWHTFWMLHRDRDLIGGAYFKGLPDGEGMAELTCRVNRDYTNQGYATEAVSKLLEWAMRQEGVRFVTAETEKDISAAHRVLEKCGFEKYKATETSYRWMIDANMLAKKKAQDNPQGSFDKQEVSAIQVAKPKYADASLSAGAKAQALSEATEPIRNNARPQLKP